MGLFSGFGDRILGFRGHPGLGILIKKDGCQGAAGGRRRGHNPVLPRGCCVFRALGFPLEVVHDVVVRERCQVLQAVAVHVHRNEVSRLLPARNLPASRH